MGKTGDIFRNKTIYQHRLLRWDHPEGVTRHISFGSLVRSRRRAKNLRKRLGKIIHIPNDGLPLAADEPNCHWVPHNADWAWRPEIWRTRLAGCDLSFVANRSKLCDNVTLFHDCSAPDLHLSQRRHQRDASSAPFDLNLEIFGFSGSFLSLALNFPKQAIDGLNRNHILRVSASIGMAHPLTVFARLNIQHGPNTAQILREFPMEQSKTRVEFDLAHVDMNEKRLGNAWVDLIFEAPTQNQIALRDLTFSRRPRAQV